MTAVRARSGSPVGRADPHRHPEVTGPAGPAPVSGAACVGFCPRRAGRPGRGPLVRPAPWPPVARARRVPTGPVRGVRCGGNRVPAASPAPSTPPGSPGRSSPNATSCRSKAPGNPSPARPPLPCPPGSPACRPRAAPPAGQRVAHRADAGERSPALHNRPAPSARFQRSETARAEAFSDGVFAIAATILVLGLAVPRHPSDVWGTRWPGSGPPTSVTWRPSATSRRSGSTTTRHSYPSGP